MSVYNWCILSYLIFSVLSVLSRCLVLLFDCLVPSLHLFFLLPPSFLLYLFLPPFSHPLSLCLSLSPSLFAAPDGLSPPRLVQATSKKLNVSWSAPAHANAPGPLRYSLQMRTSPQRPVIRSERAWDVQTQQINWWTTLQTVVHSPQKWSEIETWW